MLSFARIFVITIIVLSLNWSHCWRLRKLEPKIFGDKLAYKDLMTSQKVVQKRILMMHDFFRTKAQPPASNMLSMKWHKGAANTAYKWASQCHFLTHDSPEGRTQRNFGPCGQNIFVATHKVPWLFVLKTWFAEKDNFTYGGEHNKLEDIGHYTQMVWASSHKLGCAFRKCKSGGPRNKLYYSYVCNYCPPGNNPELLNTPYKVGAPCSDCPGSCHSNSIRLCTNSCNYSDRWSNCRELNETWSDWLCKNRTEDGRERKGNCRATCNCKGKIFD